jgi:hypothetical protein
MPDPRYAIYYAPSPDSALWRFGSEVIGYDAAAGSAVEGFAPPGFSLEVWRESTSSPRMYGFHATLKAPFRLNGRTEENLMSTLVDFGSSRSVVDLGPMRVTALTGASAGRGFVALTPLRTSPGLRDLERDIVLGFDDFRRPLTDAERAKRRPESLTELQRSYLDAHGYPFVLDEFRFHMTLTGVLDDAPATAAILGKLAAERLGDIALTIDGLALFRQDSPDGRFRIVGRASLSGTA